MKPLRNSIHKFLKSAEVTFFEGLYRDYFTRTLFFAQQYLPDPEEAREIAQETFVTLWEKRTEIRQRTSFYSNHCQTQMPECIKKKDRRTKI